MTSCWSAGVPQIKTVSGGESTDAGQGFGDGEGIHTTPVAHAQGDLVVGDFFGTDDRLIGHESGSADPGP